MRVLLHTGKGGVGKTTVALATALGAARHGHRVCVLSTDPAHSLSDALGAPIGRQGQRIAEGVWAREVRAQDDLDRSWIDVQAWLRALLRGEADELVVEELIAFPGVEELMALRSIGEMAVNGEFDVCVVDCAPTGSTLRMLRFPDALRIFMAHFFDLERKGARLLRPLLRGVDAGRLIPGEDFFDAFEKLYETVDAVQRILLDGTRTSARLIVNPTRIVVDESRRAFSYLSLHGIVTDAVIVNRVMPESAGRGYFRRWVEHERAELARIEADFPVPILQSGLRTAEVIGIPSLEELAGELFGLMDPAAPLSKGQPLRVRGSEGLLCLEIDLPGVAVEEVEVQMKGDELLLRVRDARRVLALPESLVGRPLERVRLRSSTLEIGFGHG